MSLFDSVKKSVAERREAPNPRVLPQIVLCSLGTAAYLLTALLVSPEQREFHFVSEDGAVTALSAIYIAMASGLAAACFYLVDGAYPSSRAFWLLAALALGYLALDELLTFHENLDIWLSQTHIGAAPVFRNWNDAIIIGYGAAALLVVVYCLPEILRYPRFSGMLTMAFAFFCVHTAIDATQEPNPVSTILEESAKLYCGLFLALSMFVGLIGIVHRDRKRR